MVGGERDLTHFESCTVTRARRTGQQQRGRARSPQRPQSRQRRLRGTRWPRPTSFHEYLVPAGGARIVPFIHDLRALFRAQDANLVNASIHAVRATMRMSYAPPRRPSQWCSLNRVSDRRRSWRADSDLIDLAARHGGPPFLPTSSTTARAAARSYPEIRAFFAAKRQSGAVRDTRTRVRAAPRRSRPRSASSAARRVKRRGVARAAALASLDDSAAGGEDDADGGAGVADEDRNWRPEGPGRGVRQRARSQPQGQQDLNNRTTCRPSRPLLANERQEPGAFRDSRSQPAVVERDRRRRRAPRRPAAG